MTPQELPQLKVPANFDDILLEVIDPAQSLDYIEFGGRSIPIRVLTISAEKKFHRTSLRCGNDFEKLLVSSGGELCHHYYPDLPISWAAAHASQDELQRLHIGHLEKSSLNNEVENVVEQVINQIKWKPPDTKRNDELKIYTPSSIFISVFGYTAAVEGRTLQEVWHSMTRGMLAITRLSNRILNDRLRAFDPETPSPVTVQMTEAKTANEYLAGLASQGVNI